MLFIEINDFSQTYFIAIHLNQYEVAVLTTWPVISRSLCNRQLSTWLARHWIFSVFDSLISFIFDPCKLFPRNYFNCSLLLHASKFKHSCTLFFAIINLQNFSSLYKQVTWYLMKLPCFVTLCNVWFGMTIKTICLSKKKKSSFVSSLVGFDLT